MPEVGVAYLGQPGDLRGGSWANNPDNARAAYRNNNNPHNRNDNNGFRVVVRRPTSQVHSCEQMADTALPSSGYPTTDSCFQSMSTDPGLWNAVNAGDEMAQVCPVCTQPWRHRSTARVRHI